MWRVCVCFKFLFSLLPLLSHLLPPQLCPLRFVTLSVSNIFEWVDYTVTLSDLSRHAPHPLCLVFACADWKCAHTHTHAAQCWLCTQFKFQIVSTVPLRFVCFVLFNLFRLSHTECIDNSDGNGSSSSSSPPGTPTHTLKTNVVVNGIRMRR